MHLQDPTVEGIISADIGRAGVYSEKATFFDLLEHSTVTTEKSLASRTPARLPELADVVDNDLPVAYLFACPWSVESNV